MDGFDDPFWTLEQVLGWIMTGSRELVARTSANAHGSDWAYRAALLSVLLENHEESSHSTKKTLKEAEREILFALQSGNITGNGSPSKYLPRVDIDRKLWVDVSIFFDSSGLPRVGIKEYPYTWGYENLIFERDSILSFWKEEENKRALARTAKDKTRVWLVGLMRASPDRKTMTRDEAINQAAAEYGKLSDREAKSIWAAAVEETGALAWSSPGRTKKSMR